MKSLKEINEEKNQNLEVALRHLSHWILKEKKQSPASANPPLGELIVGALEITGGQLVQDEHSPAPTKTIHQKDKQKDNKAPQ